MDPLVDDFQVAFNHLFGVEVKNTSITVHYENVYLMGKAYQVNKPASYSIIVELSNLETSDSFKTAWDLKKFVSNGLMDKALNGKAKIVALNVDRNADQTYTTTLEFIASDIEAFSLAVRDIGYTLYSQEFDNLMDETLKT